MHLQLFPEELLERILSLCVSSPPFPPARPAWHSRPRSPKTSQPSERSRTAVLQVSRLFHRIATPLFYHTILLRSPAQSLALAQSVQSNPALGLAIRRIVLAGSFNEAAPILTASPNVFLLDLTLDCAEHTGPNDLASAFHALTQVRHLILRKAPNVYLTQPAPKYIIAEIARAIANRWSQLETANIAFRLSDDSPLASPTSPYLTSYPLASFAAQTTSAPTSQQSQTPAPQTPPHSLGPSSLLTHALAHTPALHTFATHLPSVWNSALLTVSANPRLERIVLADGSGVPPHHRPDAYGSYGEMFQAPCAIGQAAPAARGGDGYTCYGYVCGEAHHCTSSAIVGTGLFLMEARKHPRLSELIRAGTPIIRSRAQTMAPLLAHPLPGPSRSATISDVANPNVTVPARARRC